MIRLNDTHDPDRGSWVASANRPGADFPIQNLPLGVFGDARGGPRGGIAIGDRILDLAAGVGAGLFSGDAEEAARAAMGAALNPLMALGGDAASALRAAACGILAEGSPARATAEPCLVAMAEATMTLPAEIGSFTDFLCSYDHVLRMSPSGAPPPAFDRLPLAYHSRATTVRVDGTPLVRPRGQFAGPDGAVVFGPERAQDFELELGVFVGPGNPTGAPIPIDEASAHVFGYCLLNDWSARGIQFFESQPLGPFLGKSTMTSISPWVITAEALAPFAAPARPRAPGGAPPAHLTSAEDQAGGGLDLVMSADWSTRAMRRKGVPAETVVETNFRDIHWTPAQMLCHHASNGCELAPGDLFGSGTVSGAARKSRACLAEINEKGEKTIRIGGEPRTWLEDGDEISFRARAERAGHAAIGFGACRGTVAPCPAWPGPPGSPAE